MRSQVLVPVAFLTLLAVFVGSQFAGSDEPALAASKQVTDAVTVIKSDVGWSLRLRAFEVLKREGSADAIAELVKLTGHEDVRLSATACTALARMKSDASKGKLKDLISDTSEDAGLRRAAMNALARHCLPPRNPGRFLTVIKSDVGPGQECRALERIRAAGTKSATTGLVKLMGNSDTLMSQMDSTTLARFGTPAIRT